MFSRPQNAFVVHDEPKGKVVRFIVKGLDSTVIHCVGPELNRLADENGAGRLHLDLSQVEYLAGAALGKFVAMSRKVNNAGGEFVVRNLNDFPYELFQITHLDRVMGVRQKGRKPTLLTAAAEDHGRAAL